MHTYLINCILIKDGCSKLGISKKHLKRRKLADYHYQQNAARMRDRYNKKNVQNFKVGDKVALRIPRIDRTTTDVHRLPCIIIQCHGKKHFSYQLQCEFGILNVAYPSSELEAYNGVLRLPESSKRLTISLREAAQRMNSCNTTAKICNCKKGCATKQCSCKKMGNICSTQCHSGKTCVNIYANLSDSPSAKRFKVL